MDKFFDKFTDKLTDTFYSEVAEIEKLNKSMDFNRVPDGEYKVEIIDMAVKQSRKGNWMIQVLFKILEGQYENDVVPAYMMVNKRNIESNNEFLTSLGSGIKVECVSITQYKQLVDDIYITIMHEKQYDIKVSTSASGFTNYKVLNVYTVEYEPLPFFDDF